MAREKDNEAAQQLWAQIFDRQSDDEYSTLYDPDYDPKMDIEVFREALADAGWNKQQIEQRTALMRSDLRPSQDNSPGVIASVERMFHVLCDDVEAAMERLGLESHTRLARGVDPIAGPSTTMTNVIMTDQGIVSVSAYFFRYCGVIARAFTRTLQINPFAWDSNDHDTSQGLSLLHSTPGLAHYWFMSFASFATTGTQSLVPFKPAQKHEALLFEQVARAMELYAIAHEFGHHHHAHGKDIAEDPIEHEFEADRFALRILYEIERKPFIAVNPYISSGAGAIVLLRSLQILRIVGDRIIGRDTPNVGTHPFPADRIARFNSVAVMRPQEFDALHSFRRAATRIMDCIEITMVTIVEQLPKNLRATLLELHENSRRPTDH